MAQDNSNKFQRPIPLRNNEKLRNNIINPDITDPTKPSFPVEGIAPSNLQPQKASSTKKPINRGEITRRDDDNINDISVSLQDHDEAIMYYFNNVIRPSVIINGDRSQVPIIYGYPYRWKEVHNDEYL